MSTVLWILLGVAVWLVLATVTAVLIGRMARQRDRQVPHDHADVADLVPEPRDGSEQPSARSWDGPATQRGGGSPPA